MGRNFAIKSHLLDDVVELYVTHQRSMGSIAEALGVSRTSVRNVLRLRGIELAPRTYATAWTLDELRLRCKEDKHGCWIWQGPMKRGYGHVRTGGKDEYAHRLALKLAGRPIHRRQVVMHECEVRACCNPDHLAVGTRTQAMRTAALNGCLSDGVLHGLAVSRGIDAARGR